MSLGGKTAMVFSGGLGLAAYHAGVYEVFAKRGQTLNLVILWDGQSCLSYQWS